MASLTGYIATGLVSLVVGIVLKYFEAKARVVYWIPAPAVFDLKNEKVVLQANALSVQNLGRETAEDVEIVHKTRPDHFQLTPAIPFTEDTTVNGEHVIRIRALGPKEYFTIQLLSYRTAPYLLYIRSKAGAASPIQIRFQRYVPKWVIALIWFFMLVGFGFTIYWAIHAFVFISENIGVW